MKVRKYVSQQVPSRSHAPAWECKLRGQTPFALTGGPVSPSLKIPAGHTRLRRARPAETIFLNCRLVNLLTCRLI